MDKQYRQDIDDLLGMIDRVAEPLQERYTADPNDPEIGYILKEMLAALDKFRLAIQALADSSYDVPELRRINLSAMAAITRSLFIIDATISPQLIRFNETDRNLTRLVAQWEEEIGWPDKRSPFVVTDSDNYFYSIPNIEDMVSVVFLPASAATDIRAFPIMIHELTHVLLRDDAMRKTLQGDLRNAIATRFLDVVGRGGDTSIVGIWRDAWLEEITCDMVMTYVSGVAEVDQLLRVIRQLDDSAFDPNVTHPAWAARVMGAGAVLNAMGRKAEAHEVFVKLAKHVSRSHEQPGREFELLYPPDLINQIAQQVVSGCKQLGIKSFDMATPGSNEVMNLISKAWQRFNADSKSYRLWESGILKALWHTLHPVKQPQSVVTPIPVPVDSSEVGVAA